MILQIQKLSFSYKKKPVLHEMDLTLQKGEILGIMGPSGCGKSTLLHLIAGLRKPTGGKIENNSARISYVFQEPRLFPWLTVEENIRIVLKKEEQNDRFLQQILQAVGLSEAAKQYPHQLSGGMKSRVSLARALAYGGDLFLLDEPFAALDEALRDELSATLRKELKSRGASAILVTHQFSDMQRTCDRAVTFTPDKKCVPLSLSAPVKKSLVTEEKNPPRLWELLLKKIGVRSK